MEALFPSYNDPIVSILLLLGTIFAISVISYAYSLWKQEQKSKELQQFLKSFDTQECLLDTKSMPFEKGMTKPLFLLALAYEKSGEYAKAIDLFIYLIRHTNDNSILLHLASAYHKAGFLKRSIKVYRQILRNFPRQKEALYELELLYEKLNEFDKAREVLEVLEAQGEDVQKEQITLDILEIKHSLIPKEKQFEEIAKIYMEQGHILALRELFLLDPQRAWGYYSESEFQKIVDILWKLKINMVDLDIISKDISLQQLYYVKGLIDGKPEGKSAIFAIDLLASAKAAGNESGDLAFIYVCQNCKHNYPVPFLRCPNCHRVYNYNIEVSIEESRKESGYSLQ